MFIFYSIFLLFTNVVHEREYARKQNQCQTTSITDHLSTKELQIQGTLTEGKRPTFVTNGTREIKDSVSTMVSVARYTADCFQMFEKLVDKFEGMKGVHQSIPQKLFKLLQAEENDVRSHYLNLGTENHSLQKTTDLLEKSKKEKALQRIFAEQTGVASWDEARQTYPNYSNKLKEFKDMKTPKYVPQKLIEFCHKAKDTGDVLDETKINIQIQIGDVDVSSKPQVVAIIKKYSNIIKNDVEKVKGLLFEE